MIANRITSTNGPIAIPMKMYHKYVYLEAAHIKPKNRFTESKVAPKVKVFFGFYILNSPNAVELLM